MTVFVAEHHKNSVKCIVLSPDEKTFASISEDATMYVCDSETGHCISGPFELRNLDSHLWWADACFGPDRKHILVTCRLYNELSCRAIVWNIEKGESVFQIEGFDFVFIHCGHHKGKIASIHWIDEDGSSIRKIASKDQHPTRILVKLWDIGNDEYDGLFDITGVAAAQFSLNGKYLAVEKQSESVVELWNLEDGKITHQFSHPLGELSSLDFSPTNDYLMAASYDCKCLWSLDTQQMVTFDLDDGYTPLAVWEVSTTGSNMIFETEQLIDGRRISSICPSRDGHRLLIGDDDGTVRMLSLEDLGSNEPIAQDQRRIVAFSPSGKMVATESREHVEFWDTTTWEPVGPRDVESGPGITEVAFSADDKRIAVLSGSLVTICDISNPENRLSFDPWPKGRDVRMKRAAFQTRNDLVICAKLNWTSWLLQVWKVKDHSECTFLLNMDKDSFPCLAPDGLTVIIDKPTSIYSWNHDTARFHPFHFADQAHLGGEPVGYSPDGKFFACRSPEDGNIRVWDTQTGQLCGKPITMFADAIVLSPALDDRSLGDRLIALYNFHTKTITVFDVHTGHFHADFWDSGEPLAFIRDGTKLMSHWPIKIYDIADLAAKHRNAPHEYKCVPRGMADAWILGQDNELLIWVPVEHRTVLCLSYVEMIWGRATKVDFSNFKFGPEWKECIDKECLKELEERERGCLGRISECTVAYPSTILL